MGEKEPAGCLRSDKASKASGDTYRRQTGVYHVDGNSVAGCWSPNGWSGGAPVTDAR